MPFFRVVLVVLLYQSNLGVRYNTITHFLLTYSVRKKAAARSRHSPTWTDCLSMALVSKRVFWGKGRRSYRLKVLFQGVRTLRTWRVKGFQGKRTKGVTILRGFRSLDDELSRFTVMRDFTEIQDLRDLWVKRTRLVWVLWVGNVRIWLWPP